MPELTVVSLGFIFTDFFFRPGYATVLASPSADAHPIAADADADAEVYGAHAGTSGDADSLEGAEIFDPAVPMVDEVEDTAAWRRQQSREPKQQQFSSDVPDSPRYELITLIHLLDMAYFMYCELIFQMFFRYCLL